MEPQNTHLYCHRSILYVNETAKNQVRDKQKYPFAVLIYCSVVIYPANETFNLFKTGWTKLEKGHP